MSVDLFEQILAEEVAFIRAGEATGMRRVQVRWEGEAARWYPIAIRLLRQLVRQNPPVEWVTQLLLPFTYEPVRDAADRVELSKDERSAWNSAGAAPFSAAVRRKNWASTSPCSADLLYLLEDIGLTRSTPTGGIIVVVSQWTIHPNLFSPFLTKVYEFS